MPRDMIERLFDDLNATELPVPGPGRVVARGRQRRLRARMIAAAGAVAVIALAGSAIAIAGRAAPAVSPAIGPGHRTHSLPPAGSGPLLLSQFEVSGPSQTYWKLVMTRLGSTAAPATVSGLPTWADAQTVIATNPAGGWVISYATARPNSIGAEPERLATVSIAGVVRPFGPAFGARLRITALAVRPDGSAVAVAITHPRASVSAPGRPAQIELVPLPGQPGAVRAWTLASSLTTIVRSLSWAPDGARLSYLPGSDETGGGFAAVGVVTFDTAANGTVAPAASSWPRFRKGRTCSVMAGAWQLGTGTYLAVEQCGGTGIVVVAANYVTGALRRPAATLPDGMTTYYGCGQTQLDSAPSGSEALISGCQGLYVYSNGHVARVPGPAVGVTAWAGAGP
jgi:hypothetical protein